jgi:hypothetical protein
MFDRRQVKVALHEFMQFRLVGGCVLPGSAQITQLADDLSLYGIPVGWGARQESDVNEVMALFVARCGVPRSTESGR